jgi:putative ABC transport system ATP-binding protein
MEELSVRENVELPVRLGRALRGETGRKRVESLLQAFGLAQLAERTPAEASIGEQQRTALARALVLKPGLLLADEPTGHQDEGWTERVFRVLRIAADRGVCCLVATHNQVAARFSDRIIEIRDGEINEV